MLLTYRTNITKYCKYTATHYVDLDCADDAYDIFKVTNETSTGDFGLCGVLQTPRCFTLAKFSTIKKKKKISIKKRS